MTLYVHVHVNFTVHDFTVGGKPCRNGKIEMAQQPHTRISLECLKELATKNMQTLFIALLQVSTSLIPRPSHVFQRYTRKIGTGDEASEYNMHTVQIFLLAI